MRAAKGEFDTIVSLGSNCAPAAAIRKYFSTPIAFPFDWWISSIDEILSAARNDFQDMFEEEDIEIYKVVDWSIRAGKFGIAYHHDFSRTESGYDLQTVLDALPAVKAKYERRFDRLRSRLTEGRTLFIRYGIEVRGKSQQESFSDLSDLANQFHRIFPLCDFELLALPSIGELRASVPGIVFDFLGDDTGEMWREEQFFSLFKRRGISLSSKFRA